MFKDAFDFNKPGASQIQSLLNDAYINALKDKFSEYKHSLLLSQPDLYERLVIREDLLSDIDAQYFFTIPEVSHVILNHDFLGKNQITDFFIAAIDAIKSTATQTYDIDNYSHLWIPDGSFYIKYDVRERVFRTFDTYHLLDKIPVDFFSPYCLKISNSDVNEKPENKIEPYDFGEIEIICRLLDETIEPIVDIENIISQLSTFLKAIVINKISNGGIATNLISGSDARYIGRTVISNVISANPLKLIEALIHESIHSTLYMGDVISPWLPTRDQTKQAGYDAVSPWTGNKISISSIQEAIFVWYGIYQLLKICHERDLYQASQVFDRLIFVMKGFKSLDLKRIAAANNFSVSEGLLYAVEQMQTEVLQEMNA